MTRPCRAPIKRDKGLRLTNAIARAYTPSAARHEATLLEFPRQGQKRLTRESPKRVTLLESCRAPAKVEGRQHPQQRSRHAPRKSQDRQPERWDPKTSTRILATARRPQRRIQATPAPNPCVLNWLVFRPPPKSFDHGSMLNGMVQNQP